MNKVWMGRRTQPHQWRVCGMRSHCQPLRIVESLDKAGNLCEP